MVLRGGRGIDPSTGRDEIANGIIEGERVVAVEPMATTAVKDHERDTVIIDCVGHPRSRGGGFTSVCAMPNTKPVNDHRAITEMMVAKGKSRGLVNLRDAGCVAVSDDGRCATDAGVMRRALEDARTFVPRGGAARRRPCAYRGRADARGPRLHAPRPEGLAPRRGGPHRRSRRSAHADDPPACEPSPSWPSSRINTGFYRWIITPSSHPWTR